MLNGVLPSHSIPHVITSAIEHPCVLNVCEYLSEMGHCELTIIPVNEEGVVDVREVLTSVKPTTCLITIMHANNEVGSIQPISELSRALKATLPPGIRPLLHTDASQSLGKIPVDIDVLGVDFLTLAGHKLYAPKGIGVLYISPEIEKRLNGKSIPKFMHGGGQEKGKRAGTENVMLIAGLGKGAELVTGEGAHAQHVKYEILTQIFLRQLRAKCAGGVKMNGPKNHSFNADEEYANQIILDSIDNDSDLNNRGNMYSSNNDIYSASLSRPRNWKRLPNTLSVGFAGLRAKDLIEKTKGKLAFSAAAACHSPTGDEDQGVSAVLRAMGVDLDYAKGTVRLSIGRYTTESEIMMASRILSEAANELWGASGRGYYNDSDNNKRATRNKNTLIKKRSNSKRQGYTQSSTRGRTTQGKTTYNNYIDHNGVNSNNNEANDSSRSFNSTQRLPRYMQGTASSRRMSGINRQYQKAQRKKHNKNKNTHRSKSVTNFETPRPVVHSPSWQQDNILTDDTNAFGKSSNQYVHSHDRNMGEMSTDYFDDVQQNKKSSINNDTFGESSINLYSSPNYNGSPPTNVRVSIKKIMDTVEKEKRRENNVQYNVIDEIQLRQSVADDDEEKHHNKRDYAADGLGNNDWRADFDRVLARSRAALFRAQE